MAESNDKSVSQKLDKLIRLLALSITEGKKQGNQIQILAKAGFQPKDIAELLGTTPNTVSVVLSNLRKGKQQGAKKSAKEEKE